MLDLEAGVDAPVAMVMTIADALENIGQFVQPTESLTITYVYWIVPMLDLEAMEDAVEITMTFASVQENMILCAVSTTKHIQMIALGDVLVWEREMMVVALVFLVELLEVLTPTIISEFLF